METMSKKREQWGSVRELPSGRYQARWKDKNNSHHTAPNTFRTLTDARLFLSRIRVEIENGTWQKVDDGLQPLEPFAMRYLEAHKKNIRATTLIRYEALLRLHVFPKFGTRPIKSIKSIDVSEWVNEMAECSKGGTVKGAHGILRMVMKEAMRSGIVNSDPCAYTRFPRKERFEPNIITHDQARAIMEEVPERFYAFVGVLAYCGLRYGEAAALKRSKVDLNKLELCIDESVTNAGGQTVWGETKTYERRIVTLPKFLGDALAVHMEKFTESDSSSLVFTMPGGGWVQNNNFSKRYWNPAMKKLVAEGAVSQRITPKDLRATCGSWVAASDGVLEAAKRLGHSNTATTTKHYARPIAGRDFKVANNLDQQFNAVGDESRAAS